MVRNEEQWLEIVDCFGDAALTGGWYEALESLAHATGSEYGQLIGLGGAMATPFNLWTVDPIVPKEFEELGYHDPSLNPRVKAGSCIPELVVRAEADFITPEQARHHPHYKWARHHGIGYICLTPLIVRPDMLVGLSVCRSEETGHIRPEQRQLFASLAAHVRASVRMQLLLEDDAARLLTGALEAMSIAGFACNQRGQVIGMTPKAEQLVTEGRYLRLQARKLIAELPHEARALTDAITAAVQGLSRPGAPLLRNFFILSAYTPLHPLLVDVISLPQPTFSFGFRPQALILIRGLQHTDEQLTRAMEAGFGITTAEAEVAILLTDGLSPRAIAEARGVSINTVRTQIRNVYEKFGITRQGQLTARIRPLR